MILKKSLNLVVVASCFLALSSVAHTASAQLLNPSFEAPDASAGDVPGTADWGTFNNVFTTRQEARTGLQSLKTFGPFFQTGGSGAVQALPATAGQVWQGEIYALNASSDPIDNMDFGVYKIEFLDVNNVLVDCGDGPGSPIAGCNVYESNAIDGIAPMDQWQLLGVGGVAPAGTVSAQAVIVKVDLDGVNGGSIFWDDASLRVVPEPASIGLLGLGGLALLFRRRRA